MIGGGRCEGSPQEEICEQPIREGRRGTVWLGQEIQVRGRENPSGWAKHSKKMPVGGYKKNAIKK